MTRRVLIHVQHLLGVGHAIRAARIAGACAEAGLDTVLASGGPPLMALDTGGARLVQLPPMHASDAAFTPYYALTERDRGRLSYEAKVDLTGDRERLPDGIPVEVEFLVDSIER